MTTITPLLALDGRGGSSGASAQVETEWVRAEGAIKDSMTAPPGRTLSARFAATFPINGKEEMNSNQNTALLALDGRGGSAGASAQVETEWVRAEGAIKDSMTAPPGRTLSRHLHQGYGGTFSVQGKDYPNQ